MYLQQLRQTLQQIDGKGYKAYKDIQGTYQANGWTLCIDYVQGDPFASPSRIRLLIAQTQVKIPPTFYSNCWRKIAAEDYLARRVAQVIRTSIKTGKGTGKSGMIAIDEPGQEVLPRTAVVLGDKQVDVRLSIGLPAAGRRILGKEAIKLLCEQLSIIVDQAIRQWSEEQMKACCELADQQQAIRQYLQENGYVAFIGNGSLLPRESGVSNKPLKEGRTIRFQSPPSLEVEIPVPHRDPIKGMGIKRGVSLIVGGGYHGKSTLLQAIERGVYNHIQGDGREYVITDASACKIRAEDGRSIEKVNISPFISNLPHGKNTLQFSSRDASGSTSQAANIMEALEIGAKLLLIDEDTSATNFMIRDARMQALVSKGKEPITPFVDKVRQLYDEHGVSSILVIGGSGDYLDVADTVVLMDEYLPQDVTAEAKRIAAEMKSIRKAEGGNDFGKVTPRKLLRSGFQPYKGKKEKVDAKGIHTIVFGREMIDLSSVEQLVDPSQTRAIARMMKVFVEEFMDEQTSFHQLLQQFYEWIDNNGLDALSPFPGKHPGDMALPRKQEFAAAINRWRSLRVRSS